MVVIKLSLNTEKNDFISFTSKAFTRYTDYVTTDVHRTKEVMQTKFLGVILDYKLIVNIYVVSV